MIGSMDLMGELIGRDLGCLDEDWDLVFEFVVVIIY